MMTENGFWKYGNLWRNVGDREFARYATTEPSPSSTECDICGDNSNNNSSKMAYKRKKKPPEDAPEIKMVQSDPGQPLLIQFQLLIITKQFSVNELPTAKFNTSKEKTSTNDLNENSIFDEDRFNTKPKQHHHSNREADNGNCVNDDKARTARDGMTQNTFREIERFKYGLKYFFINI